MMTSKNNPFTILIFSLILLLAIFLRLFGLSSNPPSLFSDENDIGYQAYTFNRCQTDYFGNPIPSHFHSYSDWQPPFYIYSVALSQKIFGATALATRIPAAVFGILGTVLFALLILQITGSKYIALAGMFLTAVSPWLIHYSRAGFGVTGMLICYFLGLIFWFKYLKTLHLSHLLISLISLSLSIYFYSTANLFTLFIFILLFSLWRRTILETSFKTKLILIFALFLVSLPMVIDIYRGTAGYRFSYINIFTDPTISTTVDYSRYQDVLINHRGEIGVPTSFFSKLFHNRATVISAAFIKNYIASISSVYLFISGDSNLRQGFTEFGFLYLLELPFLLIGLANISIRSKPDLLFLLMLTLAPVPYALTRDSLSPNATRLILMLPSLIYFILKGYSQVFGFLKTTFFRRSFIFLIFSVYLISISYFIHFYYFHYPTISARSWHTGMERAVKSASRYQSGGNVFFSNKYEPFLPFFLFHTRYVPINNSCSPADNIVWANSNYFSGQKSDNNNYFGQVEWSSLLTQPQVLANSVFVIPKSELPTVTATLTDNLKISVLEEINKSFQEQEEFIIFKIDSK